MIQLPNVYYTTAGSYIETSIRPKPKVVSCSYSSNYWVAYLLMRFGAAISLKNLRRMKKEEEASDVPPDLERLRSSIMVYTQVELLASLINLKPTGGL
jgi:hypothetical protein